MKTINLNHFFRIVVTLMCSYLFISKIYVLIYYFSRHNFDILILLTNLLSLSFCVLLLLIIWNIICKIKYKTFIILLLLLTAFFQLFWGLFDFLSRNPSVNYNKALWIFDIPNLLCIFLIPFLIIRILKCAA